MPQASGTDKRSIVMTAKAGSDLEVGKWYYGFLCKDCKGQIAILDDQSKGKKPANMSGAGHFRITCHHCETEHLYETSELAQFKAA